MTLTRLCCLSSRSEDFQQIVNHNIGTTLQQSFFVIIMINPYHQAEAPGLAGLHARNCIFDHDRPGRLDAQLAGRFKKCVWCGFTGQAETGSNLAIDYGVEKVEDTGNFKDCFTKLTEPNNGGMQDLAPHPVDRADRSTDHFDSVSGDHVVDHLVLAVAKATNRG